MGTGFVPLALVVVDAGAGVVDTSGGGLLVVVEVGTTGDLDGLSIGFKAIGGRRNELHCERIEGGDGSDSSRDGDGHCWRCAVAGVSTGDVSLRHSDKEGT